MAKDVLQDQGRAQAEVRRARLHAVPEVRSPALGLPQVRPVPGVLPRDGARGELPGITKKQLVTH